MVELKFLSLNVRGLRQKSKRKTLFHRLRQRKCDITLLQETYVTKEDCNVWKKEWGGKLYATPGTVHSKGNIILLAKHFEGKNIQYIELNARIQMLKFDYLDQQYATVNVYNPSNDKDKIDCFKELSNFIIQELGPSEETVQNLVLMGDFNSMFDPKKDNISGAPHSQKLVQAFQDCISLLGCTDIWREMHGNEKTFTWKKNHPIIARRLDYIFVNKCIINACQKTEVVHFPMTDHKGVDLSIRCEEIVRGKGYFKLNNNILSEKEFVSQINELIDLTVQNYQQLLDPQMLWDLCKRQIAQKAKEYCIDRSTRTQPLEKLEKDLSNLQEEMLKSTPIDADILQKYNHLQLQIDLKILEQANGAKIRSKTKWIQEGEKNTQYFLAQEKYKAKQKTISSLTKENGTHITDNAEIGGEIFSYYEKLYKEQVHNMDDLDEFLTDVNVPKLSEVDKESLEGILTMEECSKALKNMKNDSSPGPDGLGAAFYKMFWGKVKPLVLNSLNFAFNESGKLSVSQRKAVVTLLHKGKDLARDKLTCYRPISLTNIDYKIGAKALANRLQSVIAEVVHPDQTAYIKGRGITENIRLIDDILWYVREHDLDGMLLALDFAKAFDSLDRRFIFKAFELMNFGQDFVRWLKVLNNETLSSIMFNGWPTRYFKVERGIRQGCPLSALLFVVSLELLSCKLRSHQGINGITINTGQESKTVLLSQFADDNTLFLDGSISYVNAMDVLEQFGNISGLKLNYDKTQGMWIGRSRTKNDSLGDIGWLNKTTDRIKILGVYFSSYCEASKLLENWEPKIQKMNNIIRSWKQRDLTIIGKICVLKSLIASQILHLLAALTPPEEMLKQMKTIFFKFIWNKVEKVKRTSLYEKYEQGGLKMFDIDKFRKKMLCKWVQKFTTSTVEHNPSFMSKAILNNIAPELLLLKFNTTFAKLTKNIDISRLPIFYREVLSAWYECKQVDDSLQSHDVIWLNENIKYKGNALYFKTWIRRGLVYIEDCVRDGALIHQEELNRKIGPTPDFFLKYYLIKNVFNTLTWSHSNNLARNIILEINRVSIQKCNKYTFGNWFGRTEQVNTDKETFWRDKFGVDIDWAHIWSLTFRLKLDTKCSELHWKIIQRIFPTGVLLERMGIKASNKCADCNQVDCIEHFFVSCKLVKPLWLYIESVHRTIHNIAIKLEPKDILLGYEHINWLEYKVLNKYIAIAKVCISKYKYGDHPNLIILFQRECRLRNILLA